MTATAQDSLSQNHSGEPFLSSWSRVIVSQNTITWKSKIVVLTVCMVDCMKSSKLFTLLWVHAMCLCSFLEADYIWPLLDGGFSYISISNLFGTEDQFHWRQFFHELVGEGVVSGLLKHITFIVRFISVFITSAPPQIIRHWILKVRNPWVTWLLLVERILTDVTQIEAYNEILCLGLLIVSLSCPWEDYPLVTTSPVVQGKWMNVDWS